MSTESENDLPFGLPPILPSINEKLLDYRDKREVQ